LTWDVNYNPGVMYVDGNVNGKYIPNFGLQASRKVARPLSK